MKTRQKTPVLFLALFVALFVAPDLAFAAESATPAGSGIAGKLSKAGFYVFKEPVSLPDARVPPVLGPTDPDRPMLKLANLAGKVTLLNFWATWCPPCKAELPSIERLASLMKGLDFQIAAVSVGEKADTVRKFIAKEKYTFPVYLDATGELGASFASQGIPTTYIVDKSGKVIAATVGGREYDDPDVVAILKELAQ
jgi:thiol-disulfide isomerase/thioredoxin